MDEIDDRIRCTVNLANGGIAEFTLHCMKKNFSQIIDVAFIIIENLFASSLAPHYFVEDISEIYLPYDLWRHNQKAVHAIEEKRNLHASVSDAIPRNSIYLISKDWVLRFNLEA